MCAFIANMTATLAVWLFGLASASVPVLSREEVMSLRENAQDMSSGSCPEGWIDASFVKMGCLYFDSTAPLSSWDATSSMCQTATPNSTLVEITSEEQMAFIQMELDMLADHELPRHWWTAGTDVGINGKWVWATSLTPVEDYVWAIGRPDQRDALNCLLLHADLGWAGFNYLCVSNVAYPICQLK